MTSKSKNILQAALQMPGKNQTADASASSSVQNRILAKIQTRELLIAPRQSLVALREMLFALQGVMVVLTVGAVVALVRAAQSQETFVFLRESITALDEYRGLALTAFWESLPIATVALLVVTVIGLGISLGAKRYLAKENLIS